MTTSSAIIQGFLQHAVNARSRANRSVRLLVCLCSVVIVLSLSACSQRDVRNFFDKLFAKSDQPEQTEETAAVNPAAKPVSHGKKGEPAPALSQQELADYLRGKLLALSPSDGIYDNLEVRFDPASSVLTVVQPNSVCEQFMDTLDINNVSWDVFDPSEANVPREELLRLTVTSVSGRTARSCTDERGRPEEGTSTNRIRLFFSLSKASQVPDFKAKIAKTVKQLTILAGGNPEKDIYSKAHGKANAANK
jgi:hypothetical protein